MSKQTIKIGSQVKLLVGSPDVRGKLFAVKKIKGEKVLLDGYKLVQRSMKHTQDSKESYKSVHHFVHISNISLQS